MRVGTQIKPEPRPRVSPLALRFIREGCRWAEALEIESLLTSLDHGVPAKRRAAAKLLADLSSERPDLRPVIIERLNSSDRNQRWGAAFALSLMDATPTEAIAVYCEFLGDDDRDCRWAALDILKRRLYGSEELRQRLLKLLREGSPVEQKMAAYSIRELRWQAPESQQALISSLRCSFHEPQLAALSALSRFFPGSTIVARSILASMEGLSPAGRRAAVVALGALDVRTPEVQEYLQHCARNSDVALKRAAARTQRQLSD